MRRTLTAAVILLAMAAPARADGGALGRWTFMGCSGLDTFATIYRLTHDPADVHEGNPILAPGGRWTVTIGKGLTTAAGAWVIRRVAKHHPHVADAIGVSGGAWLCTVAVRNLAVKP